MYQTQKPLPLEVSSNGTLVVHIKTTNLVLESVKCADLKEYQKLYADPIVMEKLEHGKPKTEQEVAERVDLWVKRFEQNIPFGALTVRSQNNNEMCGIVTLGPKENGVVEVGILIDKKYWGQKYASEIASAIFKVYLPEIVKNGYLVNGSPLKSITATARPDNPGSVKLLTAYGMHLIKRTVTPYGNQQRLQFELPIKDLLSNKPSLSKL